MLLKYVSGIIIFYLATGLVELSICDYYPLYQQLSIVFVNIVKVCSIPSLL